MLHLANCLCESLFLVTILVLKKTLRDILLFYGQLLVMQLNLTKHRRHAFIGSMILKYVLDYKMYSPFNILSAFIGEQ